MSTHPSSLSEAQLAELRASDPNAFDEDVQATDEGDEGAAGATGAVASEGATAADGATGAEGATGATGAEGATGPTGATAVDGATGASGEADATGATGTATIPKPRFDKVVQQRNEAESLARQQARELADLRARLGAAKPPKDFDAEFQKILDRSNAGELDDDERDKELRKLNREEAEWIARKVSLEQQQVTAEKSVQESWAETVKAWSDKNPGFFDEKGENAQIFQKALDSVVAWHGQDITNEFMLEEASKLAFAKTGYKPPEQAGAEGATGAAAGAGGATGASGATGAPAGSARRAQNAQRATAAAGTPPPLAGGTGNRGRAPTEVDVQHMKPGTFSKNLSKEQQEALLGEGAL